MLMMSGSKYNSSPGLGIESGVAIQDSPIQSGAVDTVSATTSTSKSNAFRKVVRRKLKRDMALTQKPTLLFVRQNNPKPVSGPESKVATVAAVTKGSPPKHALTTKNMSNRLKTLELSVKRLSQPRVRQPPPPEPVYDFRVT